MLAYLNTDATVVSTRCFTVPKECPDPPTMQIEAKDGHVDVNQLIQTNRFTSDDHSGWSKILRGKFKAPVSKHISHFVFSARRPFHPAYVC